MSEPSGRIAGAADRFLHHGGATAAADPFVRHGRAMAAAVLCLAAVLRLPWPDGWWLNPDEGIYYAIVTRTAFADFWADAMATAHPPLYFLILRAIAFVTTDFGWLRSPALFGGIAAVYAFIVLGRELGGAGRRGVITGLAAGMLLSVSPRAISLSQVVRPYSLLLVLLAAAACFLLRAARTGRPRDLGSYAACMSLALTLHYSAVAALGVFVLLVTVDGVRRGFGRRTWLHLALVQLVPTLTLGVLYAWHLRSLMGSAIADQALEGWLSAYIVHVPVDAWLGLVGLHSSLSGDRLAAAATVLTLAGLARATWSRRWHVVSMGGGALVIALAGAVLGLYPLGATRHDAWLFVFVTPVIAWTIVELLAPALGLAAAHPSAAAGETAVAASPRALRGIAPAVLLGALLLGAAPLEDLLDSERRPREISEQVLQVAHVEAMAEVLAPDQGPRIVLMSTETYQLLAPLFVHVAVGGERSTEDGLRRFPWGARDVIVVPGRDFTVLPAQLGRGDHLLTALRHATEGLGVQPPAAGEPLLVLAGGWRSQGMDDLVAMARAHPGLGAATHVPGLIAVSLDYEAYRAAATGAHEG